LKTEEHEERTKDGGKSSRICLRKRLGRVTEAPQLGFSSRNWFFFSNFKWSKDTRRAERFSPSLLPLFIGKWGRSLPSSSPRRARLLPPEATAFCRNILEGPSGPGSYLHPLFTKYTPAFFCWFFFVTLRKFTNSVMILVFLSVMLRNLTDYVIIPFLAFRMLRNLTDCVTMLPFDFRHVTELHVLCNNGCQVPLSGQAKVVCHQTMVLGWN